MPKITVNKKSKIPRPMNSFMIFRVEHQNSVAAEHPEANRQEVSKWLSKKWKALDPTDKQMYVDKANEAKEKHKLLYPDYKYSPRRKNPGTKGVDKPRKTKETRRGLAADNNRFPFSYESELDFSLENEPIQQDIASPFTLQLDNQIYVPNDPIIIDTHPSDDNMLPHSRTTTATTTMNEPSREGHSTSPAFILSPSTVSSEYQQPILMQYPGGVALDNGLSIHYPYQRAPLFNECMPHFEYQQMVEPIFPFHTFTPPYPNYYCMQPHQHRSSPIILDHTPIREESVVTQMYYSAPTFNNNCYGPLLVNPLFYMSL